VPAWITHSTSLWVFVARNLAERGAEMSDTIVHYPSPDRRPTTDPLPKKTGLGWVAFIAFFPILVVVGILVTPIVVAALLLGIRDAYRSFATRSEFSHREVATETLCGVVDRSDAINRG